MTVHQKSGLSLPKASRRTGDHPMLIHLWSLDMGFSVLGSNVAQDNHHKSTSNCASNHVPVG
ncbi:hypothetical protein F2Q69_00016102 [Brassica cretica]|uniref:Uncharacterized protein n=1 Tax=Brassica cretica TaxID=69181 RepID=A0A8S9QS99_BRACR|nr:hypothetical protein F2Q69_00016102 [Brassica cretica]